MTTTGERVADAFKFGAEIIHELRTRIEELETGIRYEIEDIPKCFDCKWPQHNCQCTSGIQHLNTLRRLQDLMQEPTTAAGRDQGKPTDRSST